MTIEQGWQGRFFRDFEAGDICEHPLVRTVMTTDDIWFTLLARNTAPVCFDHHYSARTGFGEPLLDSTFTLAWEGIKLPAPVLEGMRSIRVPKSSKRGGRSSVRTSAS